jgi:hypothetical protein
LVGQFVVNFVSELTGTEEKVRKSTSNCCFGMSYSGTGYSNIA